MVGEARADAGRQETADDLALLVHPVTVIDEQILHHDRIAFHADDFADAGDLACAVTQAGRVHDDVDGRD